MPSISFTPLRVALTAIYHRNPSILICPLQIGAGRHRLGEILEDNNVSIHVESKLRLGDTLVLLIFMSDGTHRLNFTGDNQKWPVYMAIGNQSSKIGQMPSMHIVIMAALLLIPFTNWNIPQI